MRHVIRIEGDYLVDAVVETTRSAVRLSFQYEGDEYNEFMSTFLLSPAEAVELSVALTQATLEHLPKEAVKEVIEEMIAKVKRGDQERGSS